MSTVHIKCRSSVLVLISTEMSFKKDCFFEEISDDLATKMQREKY